MPNHRPATRIATICGISILALTLSAILDPARAFCGFYVARADAELFNKASKVVIARDGENTVITMVNDYHGPLDEFAMVVPVPTVLERQHIRTVSTSTVDHLDAFTAPRIVEYFDPDLCDAMMVENSGLVSFANRGIVAPISNSPEAHGVTIEARYTVGEYDILILSADESAGLTTWLTNNGYRVPDRAGEVLGSYLDAGMKFFVAKVNLDAASQSDGSYLPPLQIAFESPNFMLPIQLGMINADEMQELFILTLTRNGRVEAKNYPVVANPTDIAVPVFVKNNFAEFYKALFRQNEVREGLPAVFLEYAADINWCDPCVADRLSVAELQELGVSWPLRDGTFATRLHFRYDGVSFPSDLELEVTDNRQNFQSRYVVRHPNTANAACPKGQAYRRQLGRQLVNEAESLSSLTGWPLAGMGKAIKASGIPVERLIGNDNGAWNEVWGDE